MNIESIATYRPAWTDASGARVLGPDEDDVTLAVAAGRPVVAEQQPDRVVVVVTDPDRTDSTLATVVVRGLDLDETTPVEVRVGGAPAGLDALLSVAPGTLVIGVDGSAPAAAAAFVGSGGARMRAGGRASKPLPIEVRSVGAPAPRRYDDPRLLRERGWRVVLDTLTAGDERWCAVGLPAGAARRLGAVDIGAVPVTGAPAPLFALAALQAPTRLVAVDAGEGVAADVLQLDGLRCRTEERPGVLDTSTTAPGADIPLSLAAHDRAIEAKLGLIGARCSCGEVSYPPRRRCLGCGSLEPGEATVLPRQGEIYSVVTVRTPVPSVAAPYSLALVQLDDVSVRVLARVSDATPGSVAIGARGRLVLRRVATREGVPEYGYAFRPEEVVA